ncbi:hypothetical protein [Altererythrobacter sp. MTPC7]|uniref:hypothetical protein n=1 Tax=Altererythrobacter sp. MTPC7 TaxID=3056567 RepID=UPI0036F34E90
MKTRRVPVEIAGYVNQSRWVVDIIRGTADWKWHSVVNDNVRESDFLPRRKDSGSGSP